MSKRPRRNHAAAFKAKVAMEAIGGEKTVTEWRRQLLERAADVFGGSSAPAEPAVDRLPRRIGGANDVIAAGPYCTVIAAGRLSPSTFCRNRAHPSSTSACSASTSAGRMCR